MDVTEFWQENKRWVLGGVLGLIVYFVGKMVIGSIYDPGAVAAEQRQLLAGATEELYDQAAVVAASRESEALTAELTRLRAALEFKPDPDYELEGKGAVPEDYLTQIGRRLRKELTDRANALDVQLLLSDLQWPSSVGVEEIRATLLGMNAIDAACSRLLSAHERVLEADPDAVGVRAVQSFKVESRAGAAAAPGIRRYVRRDRQAVDASELLREQRVSFAFLADATSTLLFLEALRDPAAPLAIDELSVLPPARPGDPLAVKGKLSAILFREEGE